jgi:hypothetical protein
LLKNVPGACFFNYLADLVDEGLPPVFCFLLDTPVPFFYTSSVPPSECPSINGIFRSRPAFSLFAMLAVVALRLRLQNRCGLGLNRNLPFLDRH